VSVGIVPSGPPPRHTRWPVKRTIAAIVLAILLVAPSVAWYWTPLQDVGVVIVNKTQPHPAWREHERVHWWLEHRRVRSPRGDAVWDRTRDYVGFDPATRVGTDLDSTHLADAQLVYIADAYGVYAGDYLVADSSVIPGLEPSAKIYGGMQEHEVAALERFVARGGHVVAEFNTLEEPTSGTAAGERLGALLGARFDGWLGRWYGDLSSVSEIPQWMRERYERTVWRPWSFRGPGMVIIAEGSDRIVVIDSTEFTSEWPITLEVDEPRDPLVRGVRPGQPYWYWFSAVSATDSGRVLASYQLHVNDAARLRLTQMGFSDRIPAVVRHRGPTLRAYITGDIADVGVAPPPLMRTRGLDWFGRYSARERKPGSQRRFFWRVTLPLWDGMLREVNRVLR
jgi:hypothetical protein